MPQPPIKKDSPLAKYAYYSNLAIEMGVIVLIGVFGGVKLDKMLGTLPLLTLIGSLGSVAVAIYLMIKGVTPAKKSEHEPEDTH